MTDHLQAVLAALGCQPDEQLYLVTACDSDSHAVFDSCVLAADKAQAIERFKQDAESDDVGDWVRATVWLISKETTLRGVLNWNYLETIYNDEHP